MTYSGWGLDFLVNYALAAGLFFGAWWCVRGVRRWWRERRYGTPAERAARADGIAPPRAIVFRRRWRRWFR